MATIQSSIQLMDGMSKPLNSIINSINLTMQALEKVNGTNVNLNTSELLGARAEIVNAGAELRKIEEDIAKSIKKNETAQNNFNNSLKSGISNADNLYSKVKKFVGIYAGVQTLKNSLALSDTLSQNSARLELMFDNYKMPIEKTINNNQTTIDNSTQTQGTDINQLKNMIFASAQNSRIKYLDQAQVVSKLGVLAPTAFENPKEIVKFSELMSKSFKIGGASFEEQTAGMYQLTQALASGRLQGDEFRSIMENAPILAQAISKYTGVSVGELRKMSSEGKITADIIKNAMFSASDDINKKFKSIPVTFADVTTEIKNSFVKSFEGVSQKMTVLFNNNDFKIFTGMIAQGMVKVVDITVSGIDMISKFASTMKENWNVVAPAIGAVTFAVLSYKSALILSNLALIKNNILQGKNLLMAGILGAKNIWLSTTTFAYTVAQEGLNAALYACPISWIVGGIMLLVGALYAGVAAFNAFTGKSISATGIITGSIAGLVTSVVNFGIILWNSFFSIAEGFVNVWKHPIYSVKKLFWDLVISILDIFDNFSGIVDTIAGTDYSKKIKDYRTSIKADLEIAKPKDYIDSKLKLNTFDSKNIIKNTYDKTSNFGGNIFKAENTVDMTESNDYLKGILSNTASMSEGLDLTTEEIKYMRDAAEMEVINKFTTAEIKMEVKNSNTISNNMDIHDVIDEFTEYLREKMQMTAEGVHI